MVQSWCNWHGRDGIYALGGQFGLYPIERIDGIFPYGKDLHLCRPIRSQTLYPLSCGCVCKTIILQVAGSNPAELTHKIFINDCVSMGEGRRQGYRRFADLRKNVASSEKMT